MGLESSTIHLDDWKVYDGLILNAMIILLPIETAPPIRQILKIKDEKRTGYSALDSKLKRNFSLLKGETSFKMQPEILE